MLNLLHDQLRGDEHQAGHCNTGPDIRGVYGPKETPSSGSSPPLLYMVVLNDQLRGDEHQVGHCNTGPDIGVSTVPEGPPTVDPGHLCHIWLFSMINSVETNTTTPIQGRI